MPESSIGNEINRKGWLPVWLYSTAIALVIAAFFVANVPLTPSMASISSVNIILFAAPSYIAAWNWLGAKRFFALLVPLSVFALAVETLSIRTGFPYGKFVYGDMIGGRIGGVVPWTVPFAWIPLVFGAWGINASSDSCRNQAWQRIARTGSFLMLVDIVLDPAAVHLKFWRYMQPSSFYGVPTSNFFGWFLTGLIGASSVYLAGRSCPNPPPSAVAHSLFLILVFWTATNGWSGLRIPFAVGLILTGLVAVSLRQRSQK